MAVSASAQTPEHFLRLAVEAKAPDRRARYAELGLARPERETDPDTRVLLLRQLYLAHFASSRFGEAWRVAERMTQVGALRDIAHHDAARVLGLLGRTEEAIAHQRLAVRASPASRRSFHYWSLGTLLHFAGHSDEAQAALKRGERWSHDDRPLLRAHRAWVRLSAREPVRGLDAIVQELATSKAREGYGQFVLGMLAHEMGDDRRASVHLRAFLRRNAGADAAKALTLQEELRRARRVLARVESD